MPILRCTKKLQKEMGLRAVSNEPVEPESSPLGSWHANLMYIAKRKCVLFANDRTLFNFIATDVSRAEIRHLDQLFIGYLSCVLNEEDLPQGLVDRIVQECSAITYGNTNNRSVLGSMNDFALNYECRILDAGGVHSAQVPQIIKDLNHMPMGALNYAYAIDALQAAYAS